MTTEELRDLHAKCVEYAVEGRILPPNMTIIVDLKHIDNNVTYWLASIDNASTFGKIDKRFDPSHEEYIILFAKAVGIYEEPKPEPQQPQGLYPVGTLAKVCDKVMIIANTTGHGFLIGKIVTSVDGISMFNKGYEQWCLSPNEYVIIEESDPFLKSVRNYPKNTPQEGLTQAIDPVLLQLTCAALSGLCNNKVNIGVAFSDIGYQAATIAKATYDELMKEN